MAVIKQCRACGRVDTKFAKGTDYDICLNCVAKLAAADGRAASRIGIIRDMINSGVPIDGKRTSERRTLITPA